MAERTPITPKVVSVNLSQLQSEVSEWSDYNFGTSKGLDAAVNPLLGVGEELGELNHSILKMRQGIRIEEDHEANAVDSVGDLVIYLTDFCNKMGWEIADCVQIAWMEVKNRNWKYNAINGKVDA